MAVVQTEFEIEATTSWQLAFSIPSGVVFKSIMVENVGVSTAQIAFGSTDFPDFSISPKSTKTIERDTFLGRVYVRSLGGMNPTLRIKAW